MLDITKLQLRQVNELEYNDTITLDESYYKDTEIRDLSEIEVNAILKRVTDFSYKMDLHIKGVMTLPCAVTLKDVLYPFDIKTEVKVSNDSDLDEDYVKILGNSIDILSVIWQNIVLEIPLRVVSEDIDKTETSGDGWKLIREE